jgi:hypothetical protein
MVGQNDVISLPEKSILTTSRHHRNVKKRLEAKLLQSDDKAKMQQI